MLIIKGALQGLFKKPDFKDKESGEVKRGKHTLQLMTVEPIPQTGGTKSVLLDISIPDSKVPNFKEKIGKEVSVDVGYIITKDKKIIFYGL